MRRFGNSQIQPQYREQAQVFSRSIPAPVQTYNEFQQSRIEKIYQINSDLEAKKQQDIQNLQEHLQELVIQINAAQTELSSIDHEFVNQKESLITEVNRIKTDAELKSEEHRMNHLARIEHLQAEHSNTMNELAYKMSQLSQNINTYNPPSDPRLKETKLKINRQEDNIRRYKQKSFAKETDPEEETIGLYNERIRQLEEQKRELLQEIKNDDNTNKSRLTELTMMIDEQNTEFQQEIQEFQDKMKKKEEQYQTQIEKIYAQLDQVQQKRQESGDSKVLRIKTIQDQIDKTENEFRSKISDATRVCEKLKTALANANIRKSQQLEIEKQRSQDQHSLMQENFQLQQKILEMKRDLKKAQDNSMLLRRELSARIGPRRTASLFFS